MLSPPDADLVRLDPALPGLATLLDPDAFVTALRSSLSEADLGTAQSTYVRYKPGMNCLVAYRLKVAGATVELYAKAYRPNAEVKLRKARGRSSIPGLLGPGRIVLEDRAIVVSVFPNDSKLKALRRLADAETRKRLLRELLPDRPDLWKGMVRSLRYKPERRYVAQLLTDDGVQAVLRVYTGPGYQAAQGNANALGSRGLLRLARQLGRSDRHRILAFEWLSGRLLSEAISDPKLDFEVVATVGAALAKLHAQDSKGLTCLTREAEVDTLLEVAAGVGFVCPHLARRAHDLAQRLAAQLVNEHPVNRPIHGDFYAKQVLLADDTVALLDFDEAVRGDPAADLGLFIAHLERDTLRSNLSPSRMEPLREALLEGYRVTTHHPIPTRIELYTAAGLFRLAPDPFRHREPNWPERTEAILERAKAILEKGPAPSSQQVIQNRTLRSINDKP